MTILYSDNLDYKKIWNKVCDNLGQMFVTMFSKSQHHQESAIALLNDFRNNLAGYSNEELKYLASEIYSTVGSDYNIAINIEMKGLNRNDNASDNLSVDEVDRNIYGRISSILSDTLGTWLRSGKPWKQGGRPGIYPSADDMSKVLNGINNIANDYKEIGDGSVNDILGREGWGAYLPDLAPKKDDNTPGSTIPKGDRIPGMYDPLILDLNHNGVIDTTHINTNGAYFDIDGNDGGIRERMGWVGEGDGFLVQDKNGNGKIDGIGELFGNVTTNAFDDLRVRIDSNGDGVIDSRDSLFNTLQVWIDKNGNGITDDGELHSLSSLGITSIDTNRGYNNGSMNNGNFINSTSVFTQNGENHIAGAVDFVVDQTTTTSGGLVYISDLFLPILRGYGDVKDSVVVMHDNADLRALVKEMVSKDDAFVEANFEKLLAMWTGLDKEYAKRGIAKDFNAELSKADKMWMLEKLTGIYECSGYIEEHNFTDIYVVYNGAWRLNLGLWDPKNFHETLRNFHSAFIFQKAGFSGAYYSVSNDKAIIRDVNVFREELTNFMLKKSATFEGGLQVAKMMETLGLSSTTLDAIIIANASGIDASMKFILNGHIDTFITLGVIHNLSEMNAYSPKIFEKFILDYETTGKVTSGILFGDKTDNVLNGGEINDLLVGGVGHDRIYAGFGDDILTGGKGNDRLEGGNGNDTYVFNRGDGQDIIVENAGDKDKILFGAGIKLSDLALRSDGKNLIIGLRESGKSFDEYSDKITMEYFRDGYNFWFGRIESFEFSDGTVVDIQRLLKQGWTEGDDYFDWGVTALDINMGAGNDVVFSGDFNDKLDGGVGHDIIYASSGNDILTGGKGNDRLEGGNDNDTYVFNRGDGQDIIVENAGDKDKIVFGAGIKLSDLAVRSDGKNLIIGLRESGKSFDEYSDKITMEYFRDGYNFWFGRIESFEFSDGAVVDIQRLLKQGWTEGDDYFDWGVTALEVNMGGGNDVVFSGDFNDKLDGGVGHDIIYAGFGDDILTGGKGNDRLEGGNGNDTYVFNRGDGQDIIVDNAGDKDKILFGAGIKLSDLALRSDGKNLIIGLRESGKSFDEYSDKITMEYFRDGYNFWFGRIESFEFSDGAVVDIQRLLKQGWTEGDDYFDWGVTALEVNMGGGNDVVFSGDFNDKLDGGVGHDIIYAGFGDDILTGGKGNDRLEGGNGNDTYVFNRGDGQDEIWDSQGDNDKIVFKGVTADDFGVYSNGWDMEVSYGSGDTISMNKDSIERYEFSDGSYLTNDDVNYLIQQMCSFSCDNGVSFNNANEVRMNDQFNELVTSHLRRD